MTSTASSTADFSHNPLTKYLLHPGEPCTSWVIPTNEKLVIALHTCILL